ncbi:MAG: DNA recombination protein RmuC [Pseudomonadota bacterium]
MTPIITVGQIGLDTLHILFFLIALGLAGALYWMHGRWALDRTGRGEAQDALSTFKETSAREHETLSQSLETQRRTAEAVRLELAELKGQSAKDKEQFGEIARGVMAQAQKQFMDLANETFAKHKAGAKGDLEKLIEPIGKNFVEFKQRVEKIEKVRAEDKSAIEEQVKAIGESLHLARTETGRLVNALTAPKGGGRWGEMTLRNVMEQAGLSAHCDFNEQVTDQTEAGRQRPDAVIHLPGGRQIVVDSKVSLEAYMAANQADDPAQKAAFLKSHAASVNAHVKTLAGKDYQSNLDDRVDFVAMFIPGENFFAAALEHAPDLLEKAYARNVIITTPSTLIGLAKTVAYVWRQEKMTENAREAASLGQELYERIAVMAGHIDKLGGSLKGAVDNYNKMNSSLDKRVMPTLRKFEQLSIAPPDKTIPETKRIEVTPDTQAKTGELDFAK